MISYIHKILRTEQDAQPFAYYIAQVAAMPMSVPYAAGVEITRADKITFWWRWLPGEETHHLEVNNSCPALRLIQSLQHRLKETKPWSLEAPKGPDLL